MSSQAAAIRNKLRASCKLAREVKAAEMREAKATAAVHREKMHKMAELRLGTEFEEILKALPVAYVKRDWSYTRVVELYGESCDIEFKLKFGELIKKKLGDVGIVSEMQLRDHGTILIVIHDLNKYKFLDEPPEAVDASK